MASPTIPQNDPTNPSGIGYWMESVVREREKVQADASSDPVHDLRVALRRCRAMAETMSELDPEPAWKQMRKAGKQLFQALGQLRDTHVLIDWAEQLAGAEEHGRSELLASLKAEESALKQELMPVVNGFEVAQWEQWRELLTKRASQVRPGSLAFRHMALEKWIAARELHRTALRNRSKDAWHQLRIGIKRFRYMLENFVPVLHSQWASDLKQVQDLLGDVHDLDVLWETALKSHALQTPDDRRFWRAHITEKRNELIAEYRKKMVGPESLWQAWREGLPEGTELERAGMAKVQAWSEYRDPRPQHSKRVQGIAVGLYDQLARIGTIRNGDRRYRSVLAAAALMHDVGRWAAKSNHHKKSYKLIMKFPHPLSWEPEMINLAAFLARYHRGSLPQTNHRAFRGLRANQRKQALFLAGILRIADAIEEDNGAPAPRVRAEMDSGSVQLLIPDFNPLASNAASVALAKHMLESACKKPMMVKSVKSIPIQSLSSSA
jgi:CHAD domain-containing protein